jgi:hypothetical protein
LFKKLDSYGFDFDYFFFKGHMSCAYTEVKFDLTIPLIPGSPNITLGQKISEFTGAGQYDQGIKVSIKGAKGVDAFLSAKSTVLMDGKGAVKDYSITATTGLKVKVGTTGVMVGGQMTFGPGGSVRDSDFSAGINQSFPIGAQYTGKDVSFTGNVSLEASTKRGCSMTPSVEGSLDAVKKFVDEAKTRNFMKEKNPDEETQKSAAQRQADEKEERKGAEKYGNLINTDQFLKKTLWSRKFEITK